MKLIVSFSTLALISIANVAPCFAANQSSSRSVNQSLSSQTLPSEATSYQVAGLFDIVETLINTGEKFDSKVEKAKAKVEKAKARAAALKARADAKAAAAKAKQDRLELQKQRQAAAEEARKNATEQQRLEADRRQKYFESLSPDQQKAYVAEQRAKQKQAEEVAARLFISIFDAMTTPQVCRSGSWLTGYTYYEC
jgi:hypothetical protein